MKKFLQSKLLPSRKKTKQSNPANHSHAIITRNHQQIVDNKSESSELPNPSNDTYSSNHSDINPSISVSDTNKMNNNQIQTRKKYLRKYEEYERIYQSKLYVFQQIKVRNSSILSKTLQLTDEDAGKYVGNCESFLSTYAVQQMLLENKPFNLSLVKKLNDLGCKKYIMKQYEYETESNTVSRGANKANKLLCRWIAAMKIGIIEDGEIFHDYYGNNHWLRLVMKYWDTDLHEYICSYRRDCNMFRKTENIALFMKDIIGQLKKIHDNGMVFVDIKPSNICMDFDDQTNIPKKFGLIDYELLNRNKTFKTQQYGTVTFCPSEAQKYKDNYVLVTDKWDIFALGITLLFLIDGHHPYIKDLQKWNEELGDNRRKNPRLNLFLDQDVLDKCIENSEILNQEGNEELRDLIANMIRDDFGSRYSIDNVIHHPWFQDNCVANRVNMKEETVIIQSESS